MEIKEMTIEEMEQRKAAIAEELEAPESDLDALKEEVRAINEEMEVRKAAEAAKVEIRAAVAAGAGEVVEKIEKEERKVMTNEEIRNSKAYIDAYAEYIKTGDDKECRALLTTNVVGSGQVPVPELVDGFIKTAWEKNDLLSRVRRTYFRGNLTVVWEDEADGAWDHVEGSAAPTEQSLTLARKVLVPQNIKKWIRLSDEAVAIGGEELLRYIYDELSYHIAKKLADNIVTGIAYADPAEDPAVATVSANPGLSTIAQAYANLSDEAVNPVIIMNKLTYANFIAAQMAGNYATDPFMGLPVIFNNTLPAYDVASADDVYAIVGDLNGVQVNYPEGDGIVIKYDDLSEAEADLVKIVGRQYVAQGIVAPYRFALLAKAEDDSEEGM